MRVLWSGHKTSEAVAWLSVYKSSSLLPSTILFSLQNCNLNQFRRFAVGKFALLVKEVFSHFPSFASRPSPRSNRSLSAFERSPSLN